MEIMTFALTNYFAVRSDQSPSPFIYYALINLELRLAGGHDAALALRARSAARMAPRIHALNGLSSALAAISISFRSRGVTMTCMCSDGLSGSIISIPMLTVAHCSHIIPAMSISPITAARKSAYALRAVGAMPTLAVWPPMPGRYEHGVPVNHQLTIAGAYLPVCTAWLPIVIWHDAAYEPNDGYRALINGYECDVTLLWPYCGGRPISEATYNEMISEGSK